LSLDQIQAFLKGSKGIRFEGKIQAEKYQCLEAVLVHHQYSQQGRRARGLIASLSEEDDGVEPGPGDAIGRYGKTGKVPVTVYRHHRFAARYTTADMELLAGVDEAHETLRGPATRRILEREYQRYGPKEYQRLASISVAHLYNLRKRSQYRQPRLHYTKTRPTTVPIGERRRHDPQGRPGYLRVDTVHQGDGPQGKGLYHINAVDEITQGQIVAAVPRISEAFLAPVLEALLAQFPFRILGFHSDNGSEFINATVARLLNKLLMQQTKSRPRHSNDNGLVETKNGAVIRKHIWLRLYRLHPRQVAGAVLSQPFQSLCQLPSALRPARDLQR
jgi:transposase InsO family protein